jgi:hypothetical protein
MEKAGSAGKEGEVVVGQVEQNPKSYRWGDGRVAYPRQAVGIGPAALEETQRVEIFQ